MGDRSATGNLHDANNAWREHAERMEQERDKFASMLHDCENERDALKHIVAQYGKATIEKSDVEVRITWKVWRGVLKAARYPEMLFAHAVQDVMKQFRQEVDRG